MRNILSDTQAKIADVFQDSIARIWHTSAANWLRYGDTCSKTFFDFHCIGKKKAFLKELDIEFETITG